MPYRRNPVRFIHAYLIRLFLAGLMLLPALAPVVCAQTLSLNRERAARRRRRQINRLHVLQSADVLGHRRPPAAQYEYVLSHKIPFRTQG